MAVRPSSTQRSHEWGANRRTSSKVSSGFRRSSIHPQVDLIAIVDTHHHKIKKDIGEAPPGIEIALNHVLKAFNHGYPAEFDEPFVLSLPRNLPRYSPGTAAMEGRVRDPPGRYHCDTAKRPSLTVGTLGVPIGFGNIQPAEL